MDNKEIYKKTLTFSLRRFLWDLGSLIVIVIMAAAGSYLADKFADNGFIGLAIGLVVALLAVMIASHFISYIFKAGQIAMMTKGVSEGKLPSDVYGEGKKIVKERFSTVAAYYAVTNVIKGIFSQLGHAVTSVGEAVGGDSGGAVGGTISSAIQTVVRYLCDCCLGWVFYRKDEKTTKATMEGAVLFFKHGKTLLKILGRVFGISLLSFVCIGGVFFGIAYLICISFPEAFNNYASDVAEGIASGRLQIPDWFANATNLMITAGGICGLMMWSILHSVFVRPFILIGVLRNYIESGKNETIAEEDFDELDGKSRKFKKLHEKAE